ncbi:zinc finger protein 275 isoform X1 [Peromyscus leucopus]|uniref:zinc finger protein 275 isoform X1 n=1 Tax=Peromyscus leucopus TaxID=10041 RepID=UPI0010A0E5D5|nr:zinc finger protein 275 isoform X1 [Peromyscus leucopus]
MPSLGTKKQGCCHSQLFSLSLAPPAPQGLALPQDGAPGNQVLAVPLEMPEAQDLVSFDIVPWHLTEQEWLSLSLSPEQQALAYSRAVTSIGVPVVSPALVSHLSQGQVLLVSEPSLSTDHTKQAESTSVTSHQKMGEEAQLQEMASTSSPRANDPSTEVKQNGDSGGRGGSPQNLPIEHHFACKECGDTFRLKVLLVQHQRVHSEEKGWECGDCGKVFREVSEFNEHRKSHEALAAQPLPGPSQALEDALEKREQMEREAKPFECEECGKRFKKNAGLSQHLRVHSREKPFDCEECGQSFKANTHLFRHQKLHTSEKPFACKACSRDFLDRQELLKHQRMHTGHLPFDCDDCGKSFRGVNGLAEHQRIHSGAKPYGCPHCGKLFRRSSELTKHRRIHTGEKPYECSQCGKAFRQSSSLLEHERIHSGERPYACGECSKAFRGPSDLIKHRRIHSGLKPYECDKCGKAFRRSSGLSRHRRIHSGARRCECSECGRVFKRRSALQKHQPSHQE